MADAPRIRVLLIDAEPSARKTLRELLELDAEVEVIGECSNGQEAIKAIQVQSPDLLFLEVHIPELGGFEVLEALQNGSKPHIIFVTANDQYAARAFEVHALDYLLKPLTRERFEASWQRAKTHIMREKTGDLDQRLLALLEQINAGPKYLERLVIKDGGRIFFLDVEDIDWIEAEGNYVSVHSGKRVHLLRETISNLESQLDPKKFLRIHRSSIVRINCIKELRPWYHGEYHVILNDNTQLTLSRNYRDRLQEALGKSL